MSSVAFRSLGFAWALPATILIWAFYVLPLLALGQIKWRGWVSFAVVSFELTATGWYERSWVQWTGWGGPCVMIVRQHASQITIDHEERHCDQWFLFGVFFAPMYGILLAFYGYARNPLEIDAKEASVKSLRAR